MATKRKLDVRKIRHRLGMTQSKFAEQIGVSQPTIALWEAEKRRPSGPSQIILRQLLADKSMR